MTKEIYILDAVGFVFRSYFAIRNMTSPDGTPTNALYGFIRSVQKVLKDFHPAHIVAVFDGENNKQSRKEIYEDYKSNRTSMPEDLFPQLEKAIEFCSLMGIPILQFSGVEADDTIGTITKWAEAEDNKVFICSSDKDLCQLVNDRVFLLNTHKDNLLIDAEKVKEIYGVNPNQVTDLLAIMGDASDNIPGIPGMGPKTAAKLLEQFGHLENIIQHKTDIQNPKQRQLIEEHEKIALISKRLASLHLDIKIPTDWSFYELSNPKIEELRNFYQRYHFVTLLKDLEELSPSDKSDSSLVEKEKVAYNLIDSKEALLNLVKILKTASSICIDTETTSVEAMKASIVGIGFGLHPKECYYVPFNGNMDPSAIIEILDPVFQNPTIKWIGHNIKYDLHVLLNHGISLKTIGFDTILASYLINSQSQRHNLDILSLERFGKTKIGIKELIGTGKQEISMLEVPIERVCEYCCEDVDYTLRLKEVFEQELKEHHLERVFYEIEIPLIQVLFHMERHGMYVDTKELESMSKMLVASIHRLQEEIFSLSSETFNLNSPKQLAVVLFEKLGIKLHPKQKISTSADVLESLRHQYPICGKILEYRMLEKLRSTYVDALITQIHPITHRIHCTFNQSVAATGRLSCQDPNLQNIPIRSPEGKKIREAFKPQLPNWSYIAADYSQIELRILAHLSEEPVLIEGFHNNADIHKLTASLVFNVKLDDVSSEMRHLAKAVNFGIIYGQQAYGLSQQLGISMHEASSFITTYFERYPKIKAFIEASKEKARETQLATTFTGRQRPIVDIGSKNPQVRAAAERLAVNTPLQGAQADIIKMAMIEIEKNFPIPDHLGYMILQIHDELVFEVHDDYLEPCKHFIKTTMENIVSLSVPLTVDLAIGKNWGEC